MLQRLIDRIAEAGLRIAQFGDEISAQIGKAAAFEFEVLVRKSLSFLTILLFVNSTRPQRVSGRDQLEHNQADGPQINSFSV